MRPALVSASEIAVRKDMDAGSNFDIEEPPYSVQKSNNRVTLNSLGASVETGYLPKTKMSEFDRFLPHLQKINHHYPVFKGWSLREF